MQKRVTDDLNALLEVLPQHIRQPLENRADLSDLLEVVLDLGRLPEARFPQTEVALNQREVTQEDVDFVVSRISSFSGDNRAGIERTLHRISAIRNRQGRVVGLTCRVGRAVFGTIRIIEDLVQSAKSILLLGKPGVGKTTMLREVARVLADDLKKRVVVVDTSNEIAGDGDIPHPGIGRARRMQVPSPTLQHAVMIEAVENHMPEVIIIDEIGTELEAAAARTIAERGVQLVATAHGNTLDNLIMNPTLSDLVGGIQSVTLGDEEARRRGTQKSILERKAPPTFDAIIEIRSWSRVSVHDDVAKTVDSWLRGNPLSPEVRWVDERGEVQLHRERLPFSRSGSPEPNGSRREVRLYLFGLSRERLEQVAQEREYPISVTEDLRRADFFVTVKNFYRRRPQPLKAAEERGMPVYVLRTNSTQQIAKALQDILQAYGYEDPVQQALAEAEAAITQVKQTQARTAELSPQSAYIRRLQHQLAERSHLTSRSVGKGPSRRVTILPREEALRLGSDSGALD